MFRCSHNVVKKNYALKQYSYGNFIMQNHVTKQTCHYLRHYFIKHTNQPVFINRSQIEHEYQTSDGRFVAACVGTTTDGDGSESF